MRKGRAATRGLLCEEFRAFAAELVLAVRSRCCVDRMSMLVYTKYGVVRMGGKL